MTRALGCRHDVERRVGTHLFGISANNSGSTFLKAALATSRATWNLALEGQMMLGYAGPDILWPHPATLLWASERRWIDLLTDPRRYDWPRTRKAWYFQADARSPEASVFYTKTPAHLLVVDALARHFHNAKFLFMVRNPYAVCEGICRFYREGTPHGSPASAPIGNLPEAAARHAVTCLAWQRRNLEAHGHRGVFFTYETMCAEPERVARRIRALVPELDDLDLRQRLRVKEGRYHEMLTDMNARQIARLSAEDVAAFNRVFRQHEDVLAWFGYTVMEGVR